MKRVFAWGCTLLAAGCGSIVGGTSQEIQISSTPPGADCAIYREGLIIGRVNPTPGTATIQKSKKDLVITCTKVQCEPAQTSCTSGVEPWSIGNILFGLIGGPIGLIIDHSTGAVNKYESPVNVTLAPITVDRTETLGAPPETAPPTAVPSKDQFPQAPTSPTS